MHKIYLENCRFKAQHGVFEEEKIIEGEFIVDLSLTTNFTKGIVDDDLAGTVNYAVIYQIIKKEMQSRSILLEHLAGRIINSLFSYSDTIQSIQLKVCKTHPPIQGEIGAVCVEIQETR